MESETPIGLQTAATARILDYLRDAVVELEVWRQNMHSPEERQALRRITSLLSMAAGELRSEAKAPDPVQQSLHLSPLS